MLVAKRWGLVGSGTRDQLAYFYVHRPSESDHFAPVNSIRYFFGDWLRSSGICPRATNSFSRATAFMKRSRAESSSRDAVLIR
jgi:hypothetical protein